MIKANRQYSAIFGVLLLFVICCRSPKEFIIDKYLYGNWKIDSVYVDKSVEKRILPDYLHEMKQIYNNAELQINKDNTFIFIMAGNKMEGIWLTSADEKVFITQGFGERQTDSFTIEIIEKNSLKLLNKDTIYPLIIFLNKEQ